MSRESTSGPYVGGHPEMPLHVYEPTDGGTCAACDRAQLEPRTSAGRSMLSTLVPANDGSVLDLMRNELRERLRPLILAVEDEARGAPLDAEELDHSAPWSGWDE